ncbi:MAG: hypothetical protein EXS09_00015 [Gemmataceae bacterium]|nr:hypothetical protein [Gemmataceae bacterium]
MCRVVTIGALAIGLATIGYAISLFMASPAQPPKVERTAIVVEGADVGETTIGVIVPVHIRIHNNSNVAIRFIGGPNGCQRGGCMKTTGPCPLTIDANSVADVPLDLSVSMLGSYQLSVCVYLDIAGSAVERTVYLTGHGIPAAESNSIPTKP